jgi:hypothetical protein
MDFAADIPAMTLDFGVNATLNGVAVRGIFDNDYVVQDMGGGVASSGPAFTLASSSVPSPVVGLVLVVNATSYKVVEAMPDGTGITRLQLRT